MLEAIGFTGGTTFLEILAVEQLVSNGCNTIAHVFGQLTVTEPPSFAPNEKFSLKRQFTLALTQPSHTTPLSPPAATGLAYRLVAITATFRYPTTSLPTPSSSAWRLHNARWIPAVADFLCQPQPPTVAIPLQTVAPVDTTTTLSFSLPLPDVHHRSHCSSPSPLLPLTQLRG
ncbi:hypothetical protein BHE74_00046264 [Ensete ventricosum]|nr:hypothetical protein GW17_00039714 [Ensete ventricosum]RWW47716.1 hypothetical protein BHE74_00046264 [Ensete ventricosum]